MSIQEQAQKDVVANMVRVFKEEHNVDLRCDDIAYMLFPIVLNQEDLGNILSKRILDDNRLTPSIILSGDEMERLETLIYEQCANLISIRETKEAYKAVVDATDKIIHTLRNAIDFIIDRFESDEQAY